MSLNSQVVNFGNLVIGWILFVILHFTVLILLISGLNSQVVNFGNLIGWILFVILHFT